VILEGLAGLVGVLLVAGVGVPVLVFALQVLTASLLGVGRSSAGSDVGDGRHPLTAVLVPAHDEELGIGATIDALRPQLQPGDRVLVVADNCRDATADVARRHGAEVFERVDAQRRGKGYALDAGLRHLAKHPPQVVVVVDADCLVEAGALGRIARRAVELDRPVQAYYAMLPVPDPGLGQRVAAFAWTVKNLVRPAGAARWGLPCQLMGTGMAMPWSSLETVSLASGHIVEDMKLGVDLALMGRPPAFEPAARVTSEFPTSAVGEATQRARWEHGHLQVLLAQGPRLLMQGLRRADWRAVGLAADLMVPPVSLLFTLALLAALAGAALGWTSGLSWIGWSTAAVLGLLVATLLIAWARFGRDALSVGDLLRAPLVALGKLPLYLQFVVGRQSQWVRTRRKGE
jgi:cellulose synthase/poly-beta-1,6-N-acetylglucosamine synthase-like glycosyltransferase